MLIEVVQSAVFGALTTGRIKPHEVIVIEGDRIGTLAGKLSDLRYLVERELIEDEPTSDEEDEVEGAVEEAVEEVVEGTAETVEGTVEAPQEPYEHDGRDYICSVFSRRHPGAYHARKHPEQKGR